jgi:hypothetical protein
MHQVEAQEIAGRLKDLIARNAMLAPIDVEQNVISHHLQP